MFKIFSIVIILSLPLTLACTKKDNLEKINSTEILKKTPSISNFKEESEKLPKGCPENYDGALYGESHFGQIHHFENESELWLCGDGTLKKFMGSIYLKPKKTNKTQKIKTFGGVSELWNTLSTDWVAIKLKSKSFEVVQLIPYRNKTHIVSSKLVFDCSSSLCSTKKEVTCMFKQPKGSPTGKALIKMKSYISDSQRSPKPKDVDKVSKNVPTDQDFFDMYLDALDGHKKSIQFFINTNTLPQKIKNAYMYENPEPTFQELKKHLSNLNRNNCL